MIENSGTEWAIPPYTLSCELLRRSDGMPVIGTLIEVVDPRDRCVARAHQTQAGERGHRLLHESPKAVQGSRSSLMIYCDSLDRWTTRKTCPISFLYRASSEDRELEIHSYRSRLVSCFGIVSARPTMQVRSGGFAAQQLWDRQARLESVADSTRFVRSRVFMRGQWVLEKIVMVSGDPKRVYFLKFRDWQPTSEEPT